MRKLLIGICLSILFFNVCPANATSELYGISVYNEFYTIDTSNGIQNLIGYVQQDC